jgi:DNA polymerase-3 subunit gamma/tau
MTLLRMLAFAPELAAEPAGAARSAALTAAKPLRATVAPARAERAAPVQGEAPAAPGAGATAGPAAAPLPPLGAALDWPTLAAGLKLTGLARELAMRSELVGLEGELLSLRVPVKALLEAGSEARLRAALSEHFGRPMRLSVQVGATAGDTAASRSEQARAALQRQAEEAIRADPFVRELIDNFGASVDPRSIRPAKPDA